MLVKSGWLAIYGKGGRQRTEGGKDGDKGQPWCPSARRDDAHRVCRGEGPENQTARALLSEATLLGAMESAGKWIDDDELRSAMQEKGLGTPATPRRHHRTC